MTILCNCSKRRSFFKEISLITEALRTEENAVVIKRVSGLQFKRNGQKIHHNNFSLHVTDHICICIYFIQNKTFFFKTVLMFQLNLCYFDTCMGTDLITAVTSQHYRWFTQHRITLASCVSEQWLLLYCCFSRTLTF